MIDNITDPDFLRWRNSNNSEFHDDYKNLKRRHMLLSSLCYNNIDVSMISTLLNSLEEMKNESTRMYIFCKNYIFDLETLNSLKSIFKDCKSIMENMDRFLQKDIPVCNQSSIEADDIIIKETIYPEPQPGSMFYEYYHKLWEMGDEYREDKTKSFEENLKNYLKFNDTVNSIKEIINKKQKYFRETGEIL